MTKLTRGTSLAIWIGVIPIGISALFVLLPIRPAVAEDIKPQSRLNSLASGISPHLEAADLPLEEVGSSSVDATQRSELESAATTVDEWIEQIARADLVEITGIRVEEVEEGVTLQLETTGELSAPTTSITGNAAIADISNAVLNLPDGEDFFAGDPAEGIVLINVTNLPDNQVRIAITGTDAPPTLNITTVATGLTVSVTPGDSTAQTPEDDSIQISVTGEQTDDDYFLPNASTATRTDTPILDVPASIQVVPRKVLEDQQVTRLDEALNNVSGVTSGGTFGNTSLDFNIRGFDAPTLRNGFREFGGFTGASPTITNLERVEVLKGPASILYGEIQPGGVINLVTEQPLAEPLYRLELDVGNRGVFQPQIDLTGPLNAEGSVLYRLNASYFHDNGFTNYEQDTERAFVAPVLAVKFGDRTDLTLSVEYTNEKLPFDNGLVAFGDGVIDIPFDRITGEPDDFVDNESLRLGYELEHRFNDSWRIRNAFEYSNRDLLDVGFIPLEFDEATGILTRFPARQDLDIENFSLQTNIVGEFATGSVDHTLLFGVDLNRTEDRESAGFDLFSPSFLDLFNPQYGLAPEIGNNLPLFSDTDIQSDRLGVYLQNQIELLDGLILLAGIRYDTVEQITTSKPSLSAPFESETTRNDDAWTPRVGIVYQPVEFLSLFASYSQSFTPSLDTTSSGDPLEPERGEGFELGVKAEFLDGNLFANLAYFDITRQNVATQDPLDPFALVATGKQRSRGIELDVVGEISPGWNVIASYAYIDAEVTEDNLIPVGNRLFNVPEHSASLWTTYEIQRGNLQGLGFGLGFNFLGEREGDLNNSFQVDDFFLTNAAIFYRRDNWRFALNAKNIFDIDYIASTNNSRTNAIEPGAPFTIIGSVAVEF
ncbi:TonB-dependent siderophore receptor [Rubidibacter lacunae KORDI 51-2]|uniref:TonB-dependent siderophore receptor n=1 Tax=Rubidibacter lacunae KORDI 51-2 TaxID=582515 RepID=U5DP97_9CHRO|nr:TonB-dependent siderophore receptor [Rubidibacter lacunae]ERN42434.1 TonB-dependent siderophore receptor [Rubidibacter lacunae KORDI 51-2]